MTAAKVRENRLREAAKRQGLTLHKSRRRDPRATEYGKYWLLRNGEPVTATAGITIDEVEEYLTK